MLLHSALHAIRTLSAENELSQAAASVQSLRLQLPVATETIIKVQLYYIIDSFYSQYTNTMVYEITSLNVSCNNSTDILPLQR